jgi:hypothetical protein
VVRRRLVIKRLDPWSVLKFGALANVAALTIFLLIAAVVWFIVQRLQLVDKACGIATDVGFSSCGLSGGNLFRAMLLLGLLWVVVQTAVLVFLSFLHNLIADLTGGIVIGIVEEGAPSAPPAPTAAPGWAGGSAPPPAARDARSRPSRAAPDPWQARAPYPETMPQAGGRDSDDLFGRR